MKYFLIFFVLVGFAISPYLVFDSFGLCVENQDWQDAPCYGCRGCYPGLEQEKIDWLPYYDFKGSTWMNAKKQQLETAIHNNSLREWFEQSDSGAHKNVHRYYFLQGDVPNTYGMNFDEALGFERAWNAVEDNSPDAPLFLWAYHDVILDGTLIETDLAVTITGDHVPLYHIKANKYFKGDKSSELISAVENPDDVEFELSENGLFYLKKLQNQNLYTVTIASVPTFGNCDARDMIEISPVLPNEKPPRSMPVGGAGIDPCIPDYFETDPDGIAYNTSIPESGQDEPTSQNESTFPRHGNPPDAFTPLQHERNGTPFNQMQCRNDNHVLIQKYDGSPACVTPETKEKLVDRDWAKTSDTTIWKKHITVSATRHDSPDLADFLPVSELEEMYGDKVISQLLAGADGCKNETKVCKIPSGVSVDRQYSFLPSDVLVSDNDQFSVSLDAQQAEYLLSVMDWKNVDDSFFNIVQQNEKQYLLVLSTFDDARTPVVKMNLVGTSHEPVLLERGAALEYPIRVDTWATYGAPAQIDLFAVNDAKDSGIKVWVEPETMMVPERSNATSTLFIRASDNARDGIYDIRVTGKANGNNASLHCSNTVCPTVNIGNSVWDIRTFGSDAGMGIGGGLTPENTWMELELNKDEFVDGDVAEIRAYLVNNGTETVQFVPRELLITVIKAQPVGYYDHLYGIHARYESDKAVVLEPKSTTLLVRPFYWNQTTFQSFDDEQRLDPKQYKMTSRFVGEGSTWYDDVWFEVK